MAKVQAKVLGCVLQDSETMMCTILNHAPFFPSKQAHSHWSYSLCLGPPLTGVPMLDFLVLEAVQDPARNAKYKLDVETCAHIVQSLWLRVLPS
jgi:hypothetical protein